MFLINSLLYLFRFSFLDSSRVQGRGFKGSIVTLQFFVYFKFTRIRTVLDEMEVWGMRYWKISNVMNQNFGEDVLMNVWGICY